LTEAPPAADKKDKKEKKGASNSRMAQQEKEAQQAQESIENLPIEDPEIDLPKLERITYTMKDAPATIMDSMSKNLFNDIINDFKDQNLFLMNLINEEEEIL